MLKELLWSLSVLTVSEAVVAAAVSALASSAAKTPSAPQQVTAATIRMVTNSLLNLVFIMEPSVIFCFIPRPSVKALL